MYGRTNRQTYGRTYRFPLFYRTLAPEPLPKKVLQSLKNVSKEPTEVSLETEEVNLGL